MGWQKILAEGFSTAKALLEYLELPAALGDNLAEMQFKTRVPRSFAARMERGNAADPLLLQVLASALEREQNPDYTKDSLKEAKKNPIPGVLHKYSGRILLTLTGVCAVNCRFCFRRHFPYEDNNPGQKGWKDVVDYIQRDGSIYEVIFSGGDPLLASDNLFKDLLGQISNIPHVQTVRFHTRIPVVFPERITKEFLAILKHTPLEKVMVLHCNHPQEIDKEVLRVCQALRATNCHLLNQSVLLKGVNDDVSVLVALSKSLFAAGVLPYYLHLLDKIAGTQHFDMPDSEALKIYRELQNMLPGYLVPRLAREEAGKGSKTLLI